jgi:hypothetical protein
MTNDDNKKVENNAAPKKRNRNRKKKPKGNNNKSEDNNNNNAVPKEEATTTITGALNPHTVLRNNILADGFTGDQVDQAMEEMWNKSLAYDEYDAVLKYLKSGGKKDVVKKEDQEGKPQTEEEGGGTEVSKEEEEEETADNEPAAPAKRATPPPAQMTMAEKLDMVAGFENMTDAVFALTEWVNKAAKPHEVSLEMLFSVFFSQ